MLGFVLLGFFVLVEMFSRPCSNFGLLVDKEKATVKNAWQLWCQLFATFLCVKKNVRNFQICRLLPLHWVWFILSGRAVWEEQKGKYRIWLGWIGIVSKIPSRLKCGQGLQHDFPSVNCRFLLTVLRQPLYWLCHLVSELSWKWQVYN